MSSVTNMDRMFHDCIFNHPLNNWNVSNVMIMNFMFYDALYFNQPLDNWDVSKVQYMEGMFENAREFDQSLDNWYLPKLKNTEHCPY